MGFFFMFFPLLYFVEQASCQCVISEQWEESKKQERLVSVSLTLGALPWGDDASHAIWFRADCRIQTLMTQRQCKRWKSLIWTWYSHPETLFFFAVDKSRRVRGKAETLTPGDSSVPLVYSVSLCRGLGHLEKISCWGMQLYCCHCSCS